MSGAPIGVVVMAYGSPARVEDVEAYYTHIRRGRPPSPEALDDLLRRYEAIGGVSPLRKRSEAQAAGIQDALDDAEPGRFDVHLGYKHTEPFIEEATRRAAAETSRLVGLVLAPHYSTMSVGQYTGRLDATAAELGVPARSSMSWHLEGGFLDLLADRCADILSTLPDDTRLLFTAHSLPVRILADGDPYPDQVAETAAAVARRLELDDGDWDVAWQSAGRTEDEWLGPDVLEVIDDLAGSDAVDGLAVCPCGFVSEHLEVAYDLDIEARRRAEQQGLAFDRTASLDDDPALIRTLAEVVRRTADEAS